MLVWGQSMVSELPSITSLRAFEAAARHLSFTRAATELDMTQGAVSQHIKNLEELVGVKLFARERKTIQLTEAGEEYLVSARSVITELLVATDRAIERQRSDILTVACLGSYLIKCLIPNLRSFIKEHPGIGVRLRTLERVVPTSTVTSDCDVSIQYGQSRDWPHSIAHQIGTEEIFPVCAPFLLKESGGLRKPSDLARHTVIRTASPLILRDDWPIWLDQAGISNLKFTAEITCDRLYPLFQAAIEGLGVAMGRSAVVKNDVARGNLVEPFKIRFPSTFGYHLVISRERAKLPKVKAFRDWVLDSLGDAAAPLLLPEAHG